MIADMPPHADGGRAADTSGRHAQPTTLLLGQLKLTGWSAVEIRALFPTKQAACPGLDFQPFGVSRGESRS